MNKEIDNKSQLGFNPALPVQTRDGRKARIICTNALRGGGESIIALIHTDEDTESIEEYFANGLLMPSNEYGIDLINIPEKVIKLHVEYRTREGGRAWVHESEDNTLTGFMICPNTDSYRVGWQSDGTYLHSIDMTHNWDLMEEVK